MKDILKAYDSCILCPHNCQVNRNKGEVGVCGETADLRLAFAGLHFGEEPIITGNKGSGTIFVTGCNLGCAFCQNFQISQEKMGEKVSFDEFVEICLRLQNTGAENINIVTGSHAIPFLALALSMAKKEGLSIPICWNSSAYESIEALALLDGLVDIWLPDLKTLDENLSAQAFRAKEYPQVAKAAISWMKAHCKTKIHNPKFPETDTIDSFAEKNLPTMKSGLIVRHLMLPNREKDSIEVLNWFKKELATEAFLSLMSQYTPITERKEKMQKVNLIENRFINSHELDEVLKILDELEIENGFYQELDANDDWLPDFKQKQPFSNELAKPIWHWKSGFN